MIYSDRKGQDKYHGSRPAACLLPVFLAVCMIIMLSCSGRSETGISPLKNGDKKTLPLFSGKGFKKAGILSVNDPELISHEPDPVLYAGISVDEKYMAYAFGKGGPGGLWIRSADPGKVILPRRFDRVAGIVKSPCFSPDGTRIIYTGLSHDVKGDIFIIDAGNYNGEPERLTGRDTGDGYPCFSPDGKRIYFHQEKPGENERYIACLDLDNRKKGVKILNIRGDGSFPAISPDGKRLAFVSFREDQGGDIFVLDLESDEVKQVTGGAEIDLYPVWSSDGRYIYFSRYAVDTDRNGRTDLNDNAVIYRVDMGNERAQAFPVTPASYSSYQPVKAGSRLFFLSDKSGVSNLFSLPPEGEISGQDTSELQLDLAGKLGRKLPPDSHLAILGFYRVPELFPDRKNDCVKAYMNAAKLYMNEGMPEMARDLYLSAGSSYPDAVPSGVLSKIKGLKLDAQLKYKDTVDPDIKNRILDETLSEIDAILSGHPGFPEIQSRGSIEKALLLKEIGGASSNVLDAIELIDRLLGRDDISDENRAEALFVRNDLLGGTAGKGIIGSCIKIIEDFPEETEWVEKSVERIIDESLKPDTMSGREKIEQLNRIISQYRDRIPVLAMGAINRTGDIYYSEGEWEQAKDSYSKTLDKYRGDSGYIAAARFALAEILYRQEYFRDAIGLYEKEMELRPYDNYIYNLARSAYIKKSLASGEFLYMLGEAASAGDIFFDLIGDDYRVIEAHRGYIKCAYARKQTAEVLDAYRAQLLKTPDDPVILYAAGLCMTYLDNKPSLLDAESMILKAVRIRGQVEYFHQTLGYIYETLEKVYHEKGRYEPALESYKKALFLNSGGNNPENRHNLLLNLGNVYLNLEQYGKAFEFYLKRLESDEPFDNRDTELQFYRNLGIASFRAGDMHAPVEAFKKVLVLLDKSMGSAGSNPALESAGDKEKTEKAESPVNDIISPLFELKTEMLDRLGLAYQEAGSNFEAAKTFEESFKLNKKLGITGNLAANKRSMAYNLYLDAGKYTGQKRKTRLAGALEEFKKIKGLVKLYGVASKGGRQKKEGLINLSFDVALDETASTSALYGFTEDQEIRLAGSFISRIEIELGDIEPSKRVIDEQLSAYKPGEIPEKDLYGVSLLYHRSGHLGYILDKPADAFSKFLSSARISLRLGNPVSSAINAGNMGFALLRLDAGHEKFHEYINEFELIIKETALLLNKKSRSLPDSVIPEFYNSAGLAYASLSKKIMPDTPFDAAIAMRLLQGSISCFLKGTGALEKKDIRNNRELLAFNAALHINIADLSSGMDDEKTALNYYEKALEYAKAGLLYEYEWRAYSGLGKYDEALDSLDNVNVLRAGCGKGEMTGRLMPMVEDLLSRDEIEEAFNLLERISELERVNRLAFIINSGIDGNIRTLLKKVYPRIVAVRDLENRLEKSGEEDKKYISGRIRQEKVLMDRDLRLLNEGSDILRLISGSALRDSFIVLLGTAAEIESVSDRTFSMTGKAGEAGLMHLFSLLEKYKEGLKELGISAEKERAFGIAGIVVPDAVEVIDIMDLLGDDDISCVRLFKNSKAKWMAFVISADDMSVREVTVKGISEEFPEEGIPLVIYEDPDALDLKKEIPVSLNAAHLLRSVKNRKPFRKRFMSFPDKIDCPEFMSRIDKGDLDPLGLLSEADTLAFTEPVRLAAVPPLRQGETSLEYISLKQADGKNLPLMELAGSFVNASLVMVPEDRQTDTYVTGHLLSLFGVPSMLFYDSAAYGKKTVKSLLEGYQDVPLREAVRNIKEGNGGSVRLIGYMGMDRDESERLAMDRFRDYVNAGTDLYKKARYEDALLNFENAINVALNGKDLEKYLPGLYNYARESAYLGGRPARSIDHAGKLLDLYAEKNPDSELHAGAALKLGLLYAKSEKYGDAIKALEEAVEIMENLELESGQVEALSDLGVILENASQYENALERFRSAASLSERIGREPLLAEQYMNIGRIYDLRMSMYPVAVKNYSRAFDIFMKLGDDRGASQALLDMGRCYRLTGNFPGAEDCYKRALETAEVFEDEDPKIGSLIRLEQANNAWYQGRYQDAFDILNRLGMLAEKEEWRPEQVMILNTKGLTWWTLGDNERALRELEDALALSEELKARKDEVATTLNNIGLVYREQGNYDEALLNFEKALEIDLRIKSKWAIAYDLRNKGLTLIKMGKSKDAVPHLREALSVTKETGNLINEAKVFIALGEAFSALDKNEEARKSYESALTLARSMILRETEWMALYGLARLNLKEGRPDESRDLLYRAIGVIEEMRSEIKIDQLKDGFIDNKLGVYETLVTLLADLGDMEEAFNISERSRSRNLIDLLGNQRLTLKNTVQQSLYDRVQRIKNEIKEQESLLAMSADNAEKEIYAGSLSRLKDSYSDVMLEIQAKSPQLASIVSVNPLTVNDLRALIEPGVELLSYYLTANELYCWAIGRDSVKIYRNPVNRNELSKEISDYRVRIQNLEPFERLSEDLYRKIIGSIIEDRYGESTGKKPEVLGIIPHGPLHYLSFATLFDGNRYIADKFSLFYLPSASVLKYTIERRKQGSSRNILAMGNPDLNDPGFDLPFAEREVKTIKWNFPDVTILTREKATESWLVEHIGEFGIIHLASHGEFDPVNPLFSAVKLVKDMSRDGDLEASEVFGLEINADLVVLSACQTGLGKIKSGDDVIGMNRAFLYGGTHGILSSLWRVSDISTAILVKQFYRRYLSGNKAESLRRAVLHVKNMYPHPGHWGAFVLSGDYY